MNPPSIVEAKIWSQPGTSYFTLQDDVDPRPLPSMCLMQTPNTGGIEHVELAEFVVSRKSDTITITWQYTSPFNGTLTAIFQVVDPNLNGHLTLKWLSATKNGKPINRDGTPATPPVIPPQGITGSFTVSGFGPVGAEWNWLLNGNGPGVSITVGDPIFGGAGGAQFVSYF